MTYLIVLAALVLVPMLLILSLKVNGAIAFMSLCLGSVLINYTTVDVVDLVTSFAPKGTLTVTDWVHLVLLIVPLLLTILFTRGSVQGGKNVTNLLPALAAGLLFALLLVPLLPADMQHNIQSLSAWKQLSNMQTMVILSGAMFSLIFLLFTHRTRSHDEHGKKHAKH